MRTLVFIAILLIPFATVAAQSSGASVSWNAPESPRSVVVATSEDELPRLQTLYERGTANGVPGLKMIAPEQLRDLEPHARALRAPPILLPSPANQHHRAFRNPSLPTLRVLRDQSAFSGGAIASDPLAHRLPVQAKAVAGGLDTTFKRVFDDHETLLHTEAVT